MEKIKKITEIYQKDGLRVLIKRSLKKLFNLLFETNSAFWFERDLSLPLRDIKPKLPVEVNLLSKEETLNWLKTEGERWMFNEQEISIGLIENHYFPNLKQDGKIIGYAKVGLGRVYIRDFKRVFTFPEGISFLYDVFISSEYRGLNLASFFETEIMKFLKCNKIIKVRGYIPSWNVSSIILHKKVGFKQKKFIRFFRIIGFKFITGDPVNL